MTVGNLFLTTNKIPLRGKQGILKPDGEGYYELPIGGFNCENSIGEVYTMENVEKLFHSSSDLQRKIAAGKLMGEWGHPEPRANEDARSYTSRAGIISDKETCVLFNKIWLDPEVARTGAMVDMGVNPNTVVTMARLKPHGIKWEALQRALDDPNFNIAFSVRNLSYDKTIRGVVYVIIVQIITWDAVADPGIKSASKWLAPRLESRKVRITPEIIDQMEKNLEKGLVRQESVNSTLDLVKASRGFFRFKDSGRSGYTEWG